MLTACPPRLPKVQRRRSSLMASATAPSRLTGRPAICCRSCTCGPASLSRRRRSSLRCASARRGSPISATPTTRASAASIGIRRGWRSSRIMSKASGCPTCCGSPSERHLHLDLNAALCLLRQLLPSVALLHENARDVAHGLIAPERLIVTPRARLIVLEHVLGSAVEQLQYTRERLWRELRVAVPASAGPARFDHKRGRHGDRHGRARAGARSPARRRGISEPSGGAAAARDRAFGDGRRTAAAGRAGQLLARALRFDPRQPFVSAIDAQLALEELLADDTAVAASPVALETFLSRYISALLEPTPVTPPVVAPPIAFAAPTPAASITVAPPVPAAPIAARRSFRPRRSLSRRRSRGRH